MKTAKYAEIRQAILCNGSKMVVKIGAVYYRGVFSDNIPHPEDSGNKQGVSLLRLLVAKQSKDALHRTWPRAVATISPFSSFCVCRMILKRKKPEGRSGVGSIFGLLDFHG